MRVLVIGCGGTGSAIARNLYTIPAIHKLYLYNRTPETATKLAEKLGNRAQAVTLFEGLQDVDFVIFAAAAMSAEVEMDLSSENSKLWGTAMSGVELRKAELIPNALYLRPLYDSLKNFSDRTQIIVVSNPVDELNTFLSVRLGRKDILGFGLDLDAARFKKHLGRDVLCVGIHGDAIPLINAPSMEAYQKLNQEIDAELKQVLRANPAAIHEGTGRMFKSFFEKLTGKKEQLVHASVYIGKLKSVITGKTRKLTDSVIGMPVIVCNGRVVRKRPVRMSNIEREKFEWDIVKLGSHFYPIGYALLKYGNRPDPALWPTYRKVEPKKRRVSSPIVRDAIKYLLKLEARKRAAKRRQKGVNQKQVRKPKPK